MRPAREDLVDLLLSLAPDDGDVSAKRVFGQFGLFVNGNMCAGVHEGDVVLRLTDDDLAELLGLDGARPFEPMGRPMLEYACVPPGMQSDRPELESWLARSLAYARSLPPKAVRKPARPAPTQTRPQARAS